MAKNEEKNESKVITAVKTTDLEVFKQSFNQDLSLKVDEKQLLERAKAISGKLYEISPDELSKRQEAQASVENLATELQRKAARESELLKQPIRLMSEGGGEGGKTVSTSLIDLKMEVERLDPAKFNFEAGWFSRMLGFLPAVGQPLKKYFSKFESAQSVIASIVSSLEKGKDQLGRDNITLQNDQLLMKETAIKLQQSIRLAQLIDQDLEYRLSRDTEADEERSKFVREELLFPLRQRIIDLQQQMAVSQQGAIATELIIRNNKELIRGVARTLNVTISALNVGATVAMALANQKITLDKVTAVNKTTSDLIAGTAARLKTQGVEIQKQASGAMLDMNSLKTAFDDLKQALQDISNYRTAALPQMAQTVLELDRMSADAEKELNKIDRSNQMKKKILVDIDAEASDEKN